MDLGLPSKTLWAEKNLGAEQVTGFGDFYSWANIDGHPQGDGYNFNQDTYNNTTGASLESDITPSFDAATVALGGRYRIPSREDYQELIDNCEQEWVTIDERNGVMMTSRINGRKIFLPANGERASMNHNQANATVYLWTSAWLSSTLAYMVATNQSHVLYEYYTERRYGACIRPVYKR